jgi:hypothetical protein
LVEDIRRQIGWNPRQVTVKASGNQEVKCNTSINNIALQFCTSLDRGGKGNYYHPHSCNISSFQGDSGEPLVYYSKLNRPWIIVGITSYGCGCGVNI